MSVWHWLKREIQTVRSSRLDIPKKFFVTALTIDNQNLITSDFTIDYSQ